MGTSEQSDQAHRWIKCVVLVEWKFVVISTKYVIFVEIHTRKAIVLLLVVKIDDPIVLNIVAFSG